VLAALVALSPDVVTVTGGACVLGTGLSTFIAHVVGEAARGLVSGTASLPNDTPARRRARYAMA
jgi:hypothetical protein